MHGHFVKIACLLVFITRADAAPKLFSCISYMEDDGAVQEDNDESSSASSQIDGESQSFEQLSTTTVMPNHRRICPADYTYCFALWRQTETGAYIQKQGCWKENTEHNATCNNTECISSAPTSRNNSLYYCCCSGNDCNQNVSVVTPPTIQISVPEVSDFENEDYHENSLKYTSIIWCSLLISCILICLIGTYYYCRRIQNKRVAEEAPLAASGPGYSSNLRNVDNINLIGILGSGKYGTVMKGILHDKEVAVKIYPEAHYQYYLNERNIYSLPLIESPALLTYYGYDERHNLEGNMEYHLVLSLAPLGCLQDWLIANVMDFETFCVMTKSITRGLSHLHTEFRCDDKWKPCIAHRDLNSRNILVKADRSCCIADFGFALKVFGSRYEYKGEIATAETKSINEVGTWRYMAPELLEGAVNLRDCETSLKQMDVYALGLILWELATRCSDFYPLGKVTPPYKGPYELEVGTHPTFDQMQALVVRHKARPLFPVGWGGGPAAKLVRDTCEDCWDHDAEARLTSLCAEERMHEMAGLLPLLHLHAQQAAISPLLSANNLNGIDTVDGVSSLPGEPREAIAEQTAVFRLPPNQQIYARNDSVATPKTEKNHFLQPQSQLQPYQGLNPCQERNLAPATSPAPQVYVQKSKKHSFHANEEHSFSCLEDDVSVEDLLSGSNARKFSYSLTESAEHMGHGFPKQNNTEKKLRGWHSVRALIQKRLFRKADSATDGQQYAYGDEKSNLVTHGYAKMANSSSSSSNNYQSAHTLNDKSPQQQQHFVTNQITTNPITTTTTYKSTLSNRRPNNLDLHSNNINNNSTGSSTSSGNNNSNNNHNKHNNTYSNNNSSNNTTKQQQQKQQQIDLTRINKCNETKQFNGGNAVDMKRLDAHVMVPRSQSGNQLKPIHHVKSKSEGVAFAVAARQPPVGLISSQMRRQSSLDMFHEVFRGRGSTDKLRDPSQRVKTPGDVPPSVRRVRASKTLSLYDDRMMDSSSALFNNHIL